MPISGLVATLDCDTGANALATLAADPRITLGELRESRLPMVTETSSLHEAEELVTWLFGVAGVIFVDVVSIDTSLDEEELDELDVPSRESPHEPT